QENVMNNVVVYVEDPVHALQVLQPALSLSQQHVLNPTRWLVVGCAPRVTHHASKWGTHSARNAWRRKWGDEVSGQIVPVLRKDGDEVITLLAQANAADSDRNADS
ncbi:MAG: hypothetical protein LH479_06960, partial [Polaromonas sp.]|nr:hypothetical protein [Polaromonas sp.]